MKRIIFFVLVVEVILIFAIFFGVLIHQWIFKQRQKRNWEFEEQLSDTLTKVIIGEKPLNHSLIAKYPYQILLSVLEKFQNRMTISQWEPMKNELVTSHLYPKARAMASSIFRWKRHMAVRAFALNPKSDDESLYIKLLHDKHYLVRISAILCLLPLNTNRGIRNILQKMMKETPTARHPYQDALIRSGNETYQVLEEILKEESNEELRVALLEVLSFRAHSNLIPHIKREISSPKKECRLAAIKVLGNYPSEESLNYLLAYLDDQAWEIRAEAARSLGKVQAEVSIKKLSQMMQDSNKWVRLQAALALRKLGPAGVASLVAQNSAHNNNAYEVAQYVLSLPQLGEEF